jgi:hypothetical protein
MSGSKKRLLISLAVGGALGLIGLVLVGAVAVAVMGGLLVSRQQTQREAAVEALEREQRAIQGEMEQSGLEFGSDAQRMQEQYGRMAEEMIAGAVAGDTAQIEQLGDQSGAMSGQLQDSAERMADEQERAALEMLEAAERASK